MAEKRLFKEYKQLLKSPASITNHQILSLEPVNPDNISLWTAKIAKESREVSPYYYDGQWTLDISVPVKYPNEPPKVSFNKHTPINHPNINYDTGEICLDILKLESWSPAWNLTNVVVAILMLIDDPEPDSPLNIDLANLFRHDKIAFESMVQFCIWKNNTFYEAKGLPLKHRSGIKIVDGLSEMDLNSFKFSEKAFEALQNNASTNLTSENSPDYTENDRIPENDPLGSPREVKFSLNPHLNQLHLLDEVNNLRDLSEHPEMLNRPFSPDSKVIHDIGEEVTKQFFEKVNEIGHSYSASNSSESSNEDLETVREQVSKNVSRQVEKLCSQSGSPVASNGPLQGNDDKVFQTERAKFLKHVDDQVNEVRRKQQERQKSI